MTTAPPIEIIAVDGEDFEPVPPPPRSFGRRWTSTILLGLAVVGLAVLRPVTEPEPVEEPELPPLGEPAALLETADGTILVGDRSRRALLAIRPDGSVGVRRHVGPMPEPDRLVAWGDRVVIADRGGTVVAGLDPDGAVRPILGPGVRNYPDGDRASAVTVVDRIVDIAVDHDGRLLVLESVGGIGRLRAIDPDGAIHDVETAQLVDPVSLAVSADGSLLIAERAGNRVVTVDASGTTEPVAGTGFIGRRGDGGLAVEASLAYPTQALELADGRILIAEGSGRRQRLRVVGLDGRIDSVRAIVRLDDGDMVQRADGTVVFAEPGLGVLLAWDGDREWTRLGPG